ncbi:unnamed protein product [Calypogeia fissa]
MIPQNERQPPAKERSWMDRMQQKLEALCETETARNPNHLVQETSAYLEKHMTTVGTNMRKFCAEFVKEMLLPDPPRKLEGSQGEGELGQNNGLLSGADKPIKSAKPAKLIDAPVFNPEASISGSALEVVTLDNIIGVQHDQEANREGLPSMEVEATEPAIRENATVFPLPTVSEQSLQQSLPEEADEQYAHWFVSEEYRAMRLGKSTSSASLQSWDGMERTSSSDSLKDWELV